MLKVVTNKNKSTRIKPAIDIEEGEMFYDNDGDLCLRCDAGCVRFEEGSLYPYTEDDLIKYDDNDFFEECLPVSGNIDIKITLE